MALIIIFSLLSAGLTGVTYYFSGMWQSPIWIWTIPLLLYAYFVSCFFTWLLFLFIGGLFVKSDPDYIYKPSRFAQWTVRHTCRVILLLLNCKVHYTGKGKVPKKGPVILINNHLSVFDEIAIAAFFPRHLIFISKPANFTIPIGGPWMRYAGFLPIKQGDMANGKQIIDLAAKYAREDGRSVCVAPEGTRNKDFPNPVLLPFHPGTFNLVKDSGVPLVVMAIQNTNCILKRFPRHRTHVYLDIVAVLGKEEYQDLTSRELSDKAKGYIERRFDRKEARFYHINPKTPKDEE